MRSPGASRSSVPGQASTSRRPACTAPASSSTQWAAVSDDGRGDQGAAAELVLSRRRAPGVTRATIEGQAPSATGAPPTISSATRPGPPRRGPARDRGRRQREERGGGDAEAAGGRAQVHDRTISRAGGPGKGTVQSPLHRSTSRVGRDEALAGPGGGPSGSRSGSRDVDADACGSRRAARWARSRLGAMSFAGYYGPAEDAEGIRTIHRALDLRHHADRHGRGLRRRPQRGAGGPRDRRAPRRGGARHQVEPRRRRLPARTPSRRACGGSASTTSTSTTCTASTPRCRSRSRSAPWPSWWSEGMVRHVGLSEAGAGDDPPRARGAPDRRPPERVLAAAARARGRGAARVRASWASPTWPTARSRAGC